MRQRTGLMLLAFFATTCAFSAYSAEMPENLLRNPSVKLSAKSYLPPYSPEKATDGNDTDKLSRWVSKENTENPWIQASFKEPVTVNNISLKFWGSTHIATDFDIQIKNGSEWKTVREVRNNDSATPTASFMSVKTDELRILFLKTVPDDMVRIYEFEAYNLPVSIETSLSENILTGKVKAALNIKLYSEKPVEISATAKLISDENPALSQELKKTLSVSGKASVPLPVPASFGPYRYEITLSDKAGKNISVIKRNFLYFPTCESSYISSSPFGAHSYNLQDAVTQHAGLRWQRNHDVYGRWYLYEDNNGKVDWSDLQEKIDFSIDKNLRQCYVFLGAPLQYSTILRSTVNGEPGETGPSLLSYYPPSDLDAWVNRYLIPVAEKLKKDPHVRAYEVWNEAWSYYRLRGLNGTAAEAVEIFKVSYDALKKADPDAIVYSTDVKPEAKDNQYAFKNFGRDVLDLGYLRYNDLLSYHGYGKANPAGIEQIRRNGWAYGRDFELWNTETATEGRPFHELMESVLLSRDCGADKIYLYSSPHFAPLLGDQAPHLNLVAQAAINRYLEDSLPLGSDRNSAVRSYLFAGGNKLAAVLFTDSTSPVKIESGIADSNSSICDIYGRKISADETVLAQNRPLFVINPSPSFVKKTIVARFETIASESQDKNARELLSSFAAEIKKLPDSEKKSGGLLGLLGLSSSSDPLADAFVKMENTLNEKRKAASDEFLYSTNKALDIMLYYKLVDARKNESSQKAPCSVSEMRKKIDIQWKAIYAKTGNNGALLNTERMNSRAQKLAQLALYYDDDQDPIARDIYLNAAESALAESKSRIAKEEISSIYKTKSYFRSHKILLRSELFCFPAGQWQEAVISLANPLGKEISGNLQMSLPEGWEAKTMTIPYKVAPQSRQLIKIELKAPASFKPGWKGIIKLKDDKTIFPDINADCKIVKTVPPYPVLKGGISTGEFTGN